uniref:Uncharacterized protein n=1 Tax=Anopheles quadriannulatus TaxID=34691 RepID=A0A182XRB8_ANOQN
DTILIASDKSETKNRTKLQKALNKLHHWCCLTGHDLSTTKSKILHMLKFRQHLLYVKKMIKSRLHILHMLGCGNKRSARHTLLTIFTSWIVPKLL